MAFLHHLQNRSEVRRNYWNATKILGELLTATADRIAETISEGSSILSQFDTSRGRAQDRPKATTTWRLPPERSVAASGLPNTSSSMSGAYGTDEEGGTVSYLGSGDEGPGWSLAFALS